MAYTVVVDANVLYDAAARDLLIRFSARGLVRVRWTDHILDECFHSLRSNRPEISEEQGQRMRKLMCDAVPDCIITGYEPLIEAIQLPDMDDRHVVAAAIKSDAQAIVTSRNHNAISTTLAAFGATSVGSVRVPRNWALSMSPIG